MALKQQSSVSAGLATWESMRSRMPVAQKWAYFDHAAVAPLPAPTRNILNAWIQQATEDGDAVWPQWAQRLEELRSSAASMLNAESSEIALVPNTTAGITLVAEGFPFEPGDNVVTFANEFPSNLYPWMAQAHRGVETRRVPVENGIPDLRRLAEACDSQTRIIAVSWVGYGSGWRLDPADVAEIARQKGALFFLDAIQGMGIYPLDLKTVPVDFLAADGHKWMMGPEGAGLFYCRREHLQALRPVGVGWNSVVHRFDFKHIDLKLRPSAARYEGGSHNMIGFQGLAASLEFLSEFGNGHRSSRLADRIVEISNLASEKLQTAGMKLLATRKAGNDSGIVVFEVPGKDPRQLRDKAFEAGVVISCRGGGLRISPHAYNNESDIDRLIEALVQ